MRTLLLLIVLTSCAAAHAEPLPCIVLNGRAWAPAAELPSGVVAAADRRVMNGREFVAVRALAEGLGGRIAWGACPGGHCRLCLGGAELPLRLLEGRSYWHATDPGGIDWWHVGTRPASAVTRPPPPRPAQRSPVARPGPAQQSAGSCPHGGEHEAGTTDARGDLHCVKCGQYISRAQFGLH